MIHITGNQLRSARAFRDERLADVAVRSGVPITTVWRAESAGEEVPNALARTLSKLVGYYEQSGIRFINNDGAVGVLRIR
jgi:transcriptional regulator with XRE-family HTH domain